MNQPINSKAISHIFKCLQCWMAGWSLFHNSNCFKLAETQLYGGRVLLFALLFTPPIPPAQSLQCLHFWIQNCTLKLQIWNFRIKSAILVLFLSATHPSCTVSPLCCLFCTLSHRTFIKCPCHCKLALKKVDKKELSSSSLLRDE